MAITASRFTGVSSQSDQQIGGLDYFYVLMLILYAGRANYFFESPSLKNNIIGVVVPVIFSGIMAFRWKLFISKEFYSLLFLFAIYFIAVSLKYYVIQPTFVVTYYFLFFTAYTAVKTLKFNLFKIYEYLLFIFAAISLFMWSVQLALGGDTLYNLFARSSYLREVSFVSGNGINAIFYSIQPYATTLINNYTVSRNCGFAWEPGSFSVYLCLAIYINLFIREQDKDTKKRFWVLLLALFSTMSTTGYVLLAIIMLFYFMNRDFKKIVILLPIAAAALIFLFSLPFMKDKIVNLYSETSGINQIVFQSYGREEPTTPQRFASLMITLVDFRDNPVLGLAAHYEDSWTYKIGSRISPISGIGNLMAQFGLVGFLFFLIFTYKSSVLFSKYFNYRGSLLLFLIIIGISISYTILFVPLMMCFWMFSLINPGILQERESAVPALQ